MNRNLSPAALFGSMVAKLDHNADWPVATTIGHVNAAISTARRPAFGRGKAVNIDR